MQISLNLNNHFEKFPMQIEKNRENKLTRLFWIIINGLFATVQTLFSPIYALLDEGIANLLALQVLRHGTSFTNYVSILTEGAKANLGGSHLGSSSTYKELLNQDTQYVESSKNYFHVFRDTEAILLTNVKTTIMDSSGQKTVEESEEPACFSPLLASIGAQMMVRALPTLHAAFSGMHSFTGENETGLRATIKKVVGAVLGFFTPTLRFKFSDDEVHSTFEADADYNRIALKTKRDIGAERIGIMGSLRQGMNVQAFERIYHHPLKFLLGLIQLVAAVALCALVAVGATFLIA